MRNLDILWKNVRKLPTNLQSAFATNLTVDGVADFAYFCTKKSIFDQTGAVVHVLDDAEDSFISIEFLVDQQLVFFATQKGSLGCCDCIGKQAFINTTIEHGIEAVKFSPDFDLITVITGNGILIILDRSYEILVETSVEPEGFGKDAFVTVGWGKKETQFHGSEGKMAALIKKQEIGTVLPYDDKKSRICWREDGEFFVVSTYNLEANCRNVRIWTRDGIHSTTAEQVDGLGQCLAWRPSGNIIASSQIDSKNCQWVIFFERNGLRHGEFKLPEKLKNLKVVELSWNCDSTVLAVWLHSVDSAVSRTECFLCLWTMVNYHWYLKKCLDFSCDVNKADLTLQYFLWDPSEPLRIHLLTCGGTYEKFDFCWSVGCVAGSQASDPTACAVVVDGDCVLITEFAKCVVPPPMAGATVQLNGFVNFVHVDASTGFIFVCLHDGSIAVLQKCEKNWSIKSVLSLKSSANPRHFYKYTTIGNSIFTASCFLSEDSNFETKYQVDLWKFDEEFKFCLTEQTWNFDSPVFNVFPVPSEHGCLISTEGGGVSLLKTCGELIQHKSSFHGNQIKLTGICCEFSAIKIHGKRLIVFSRNSRNQLFVDGKEIANNVNSYVLHDQEYLLVTTLSHKLICIRLEDVIDAEFNFNANLERARNVERGSRIVVSVPDQMKVILQMPRGNLETIFPRELILRVVKKLLDDCEYRKCMSIIKRHRLDTNLICDHNFEKFIENIDRLVDSVDDTLMLNVFLSELKSENVTQTFYKLHYNSTNADPSFSGSRKINEVCTKMRKSLTRPQCLNGQKHFTSLLSTFVKMDPPDFDNALLLIKKCRDESSDSKLVDEGLRHLLYLVDVNILIEVALGTYDFDLVLMVVEKSQQDPKEFLPFLNELKTFEPPYRMFRIDSHLRLYKKALKHIVECGGSKFDECLQFIKRHKLFVEALEIYEKKSTEYKLICEAYAEFLTAEAKHLDAGLFYQLASRFEEAAFCYSKVSDPSWFMGLIKSQLIPREKIDSLGATMGQKLRDSRNFKAASDIFLAVSNDFVKAIDCLLEGHFYTEAYQLILKENKVQLVESLLKPALKNFLLETSMQITQHSLMYEKYTDRLKIVRSSKKEKLAEAACNGDYHIDDDLYSEIGSTVSSVSTRISTKASTNARAKRVLAKKEEKKRHVLKENSPYEDLALLNALCEIVRQVEQLQVEIPPVLRLSVLIELHSVGKSVQSELTKLVKFIDCSMNAVWPLLVGLTTIPGPLGENVSVLMGDADSGMPCIADSASFLRQSNAAIRIEFHFRPSYDSSSTVCRFKMAD